ncbi:ACP S-malonyltransferase [Synechococcus lacustris]|uniref:ACP S-malonyltransferase n=1 Tax=Synechococcus lacustris TaxID=2116544 RepID=UPI0020CCDDBD|nr:ACP S-malonyltransferase [Synechococcus lacustris]MCP9921922.1 ACP S-malonyltransferase [Synechococcus lacustris Cruz CV12-2]
MGIAWVFPGQGSQKIGMAAGLLEHPLAKERFELASDLLGRNLAQICAGTCPEIENDLHNLNNTRNTQPALFVLESLLVDLLHQQEKQADLLAGHSLGELVGLYAGSVFKFETGLQLVIRRSELMAAAAAGAMVAVIGFNRSSLEEAVAATADVVIANDNSDGQVVLSGSQAALDAVLAAVNCKRAVPLAVSGAFHSPFMAAPAAAFAKELAALAFNNSTVPILSNTNPSPCSDGSDLKQRLEQQMTSGVRWRETMQQFELAGIHTVVEVGPGAVLSGLIKRSLPAVVTAQISCLNDLGVA